MLRLKKKKASSTSVPVDSSPSPSSPSNGVSLIGGIGGKKIKKSTDDVASGGRTPGEIRVQKDISSLDCGTVAEITFPSPSVLTTFVCSVTPDSGYWKGCKYDFTFSIPDLYPHEPPKVKCDTAVYHPNVDVDGNVCLNILRQDWKPVLDINSVIYGLIYLFCEPNAGDPLNKEAGKCLREDKERFKRNVRESLRGGIVDGRRYPRMN